MAGSRVDITPAVIEGVKFEQRHFRWIAYTIRELWKEKAFKRHHLNGDHYVTIGYDKCDNCAVQLEREANEWAYQLQGHGRFTRDIFIRAVTTGSERVRT